MDKAETNTKNFKKYIRSNLIDNTEEFYSVEYYQDLNDKVKKLDLGRLSNTNDEKFTIFNRDKYQLIETEDRLDNMVSEILKSDCVIGVDVEHTVEETYLGYICLIQISTQTTDYIIDAIKLHDFLPPYLRKIFENEEIVKVFYHANSDLNWINRDFGLFIINFFDIHKAAIYYDKRMDSSLTNLLNAQCNFEIDKNQKKAFQLSDWRARPLSSDQLNYASIDSHFLIYLRSYFLNNIKKRFSEEQVKRFLIQMQDECLNQFSLKPFDTKKSIEYFEKFLAEKKKIDKNFVCLDATLLKRKFTTLCQLKDTVARHLDLNQKNIYENEVILTNLITNENDLIKINFERHFSKLRENLAEELKINLESILQGIKLLDLSDERIQQSHKINEAKQKKRELFEEKFSIKGNIYQSCKILAPDDELLSYTNSNKITWYLERNMAELVCENPLTIRLKFEPSGRQISDVKDLKIDKFEYLKYNRTNQCVICGKQEKLLKYHVVPLLYRQNFPMEMKSHRSYDIVLLCFRCHEKTNQEAEKFKTEIAKEYDVPLIEFNDSQVLVKSFEGLQKSITSYIKNKQSIPKDRRKVIKNDIIRSNFEQIKLSDNLNEGLKSKFAKLNYNTKNQVKIDEELLKCFDKKLDTRAICQSYSKRDFRNKHGALVVEKVLNSNSLNEFIEKWREFFLNVLDPQFLPFDWNLARKKKLENLRADRFDKRL